MLYVEKIRQIPEKLAVAIRDFRRGYSDSELQNYRRIHRGQITPEDRENFRRDQISRLSYMMSPGRSSGFSPDSFSAQTSVLSGVGVVLDEIKRFDGLPDGDIDELLRKQARAKLEQWHRLPSAVRIIEPHYHLKGN